MKLDEDLNKTIENIRKLTRENEKLKQQLRSKYNEIYVCSKCNTKHYILKIDNKKIKRLQCLNCNYQTIIKGDILSIMI